MEGGSKSLTGDSGSTHSYSGRKNRNAVAVESRVYETDRSFEHLSGVFVDLEFMDIELKDMKLKDVELKDSELKDIELKDMELKDMELKDLDLKDSHFCRVIGTETQGKNAAPLVIGKNPGGDTPNANTNAQRKTRAQSSRAGQSDARDNKCCRALRKFGVFIMSTVGLSILVAGYCVAGAFLFMRLERPSENETRETYEDVQRHMLQKLQRVSDIPDDTNLTDRERRWTQMADVVLSNFRERVIEITKQTNWDRRGNSKWTFPGSFLFCVNVVTTIGYGNIAPKTLDGRVACIVYAVFGIPITLLCLSNIGIYMASLVKILYAKVFFRFCVRVGDDVDIQKVHVPVWLCFALLIGYLCLGATMFSQWQDWTFVDAVYFCFTTLSTIGFGDLVPGFDGNVEDTENFARQFICVFYLFLGLAILAMIFELIKLSCEDIFHFIGVFLELVKEDKASR